MKILLVGEYYSSNLGDPLLCETVSKCILEKYPSAKIIPFDISGKTAPNEFYHAHKRTRQQKIWVRFAKKYGVYLQKISPLYRVYMQSADRFMRVWFHITAILEQEKIDAVVFAGGEMFMDYFTGPIYILLKTLKKIPVVFHACGVYSLSNDSRPLLRTVLKKTNVKAISLRDSYHRFNNIFKIEKKTYETYDTALLCGKYFSGYKAECQNSGIGIGVIAKEEFRAVQDEIIRTMLHSSYQWKLFTNGEEEDYTFACKLLRANGVQESDFEKYLFRRPKDISELIRTITSFEKIISFRMHSQICAVSFGIPTFGFVWDEKVAEFYEKLGLPRNYTRGVNNIDIGQILDVLNKTTNDLHEVAYRQGELSKRDLISEIELIFR